MRSNGTRAATHMASRTNIRASCGEGSMKAIELNSIVTNSVDVQQALRQRRGRAGIAAAGNERRCDACNAAQYALSVRKSANGVRARM